ncbi:SMP-30/gluconolactonase/LRE family protein [Candidatus Omnitrophota bacterium]
MLLPRRNFLKLAGKGLACSTLTTLHRTTQAWGKPFDEELFVSSDFTPTGEWIDSGIEGPACDIDGNLYAVSLDHKGTIGKVTPDGTAEIFIELPEGSIGNGIRFDSRGYMYIADYTGHNILQVDMATRNIEVFAHEPSMNQPNDLAIGANDVIYASDPNWKDGTGNVWRIDTDGTVSLLDTITGTTNGIEVNYSDSILYVNASGTQTVWAYDLDSGGSISNRRLFAEFPDKNSTDGMRCDIEGNLYVTRQASGKVAMLSPDGDLIREITMIGTGASNVAFGGPDGRTCYVTMVGNRNIQSFRVDVPGRSWQLYQDRKPTYVSNTSAEPQQYRIAGNFPNPFNPETTIEFTADREGTIRLDIYNIQGQKVRTLLSSSIRQGIHRVRWDSRDDSGQQVSSGVYIVSLKADIAAVTHRMTLVR